MIGETVSHYRITKQLGSGGMGVVYEAVDTRLDRPVALKFLPPEFTRDPHAKARFIQEAKAASALDHNNVCVIHEIDETDDGRLFLAMARYEGETLRDRIARGPLPIADALAVAGQVSEGLAKAHGMGIVHRDIKPENIFITVDGVVKILDFGLAILIGQSRLTQEHQTVGTLSYMSPEQAQGLAVDHRSDFWSLGVVLYEMLTGIPPFQGDHPQAVIYSIINQELTLPSLTRAEVKGDLDDIVRRLLAKDPAQRPQGTADLLDALQGPQKPSYRKSVVVIGMSALALAFIAVVIFVPNKNIATTTVTVIDEAGHQIRREVPTRDYRKRLAVFPFDLADTDSGRAWMAFALSQLLTQDLLQDYYLSIDLGIEGEFAQEASQIGYPGGQGAPRSLKRELAKNSNCSHFVTGTVGAAGDSIWADVALFTTDSGQLVFQDRFSGARLFDLIDPASGHLRRQLGVPDEHLDTWPDLPIVDVSTASLAALRAYCRALIAVYVDNDLVSSRRYLESAVAEDPSFAWALWSLYYSYLFAGEGNTARISETIEALMTHLYRLPERLQFAAKAAYFEYSGDPDKQRVVVEMWADLYPDDNFAHEALVQIYKVHGMIDAAVEAQRHLLELEPGNPTYLNQAADLARDAGDLQTAASYLEELVAVAPGDHAPLRALGELMQLQGRHGNARSYFEKAMALEPDDLDLQLAMAEAEFRLGRIGESQMLLEAALANARSAAERMKATKELAQYLTAVGKINHAVELAESTLADVAAEAPPWVTISFQGFLAELNATRGNRARALELVAACRDGLSLPLQGLAALYAVRVYLELGEIEPARVAVSELEVIIDELKWEHVRPQWLRAAGEILEKEADFGGALAHYSRWREREPTSADACFHAARCLRQLEQAQEAHRMITQSLIQEPYNAEFLCEAALIEQEYGTRDQAQDYLDRALGIWQEADPSFQPARDARAMATAWTE